MDGLRIVALNKFTDVTANLFIYHFLPNGQEKNDEILIVDCGMGFPDQGTLGVDLVIPDFSYLEKRQEKIKGLILTHGHEDHIGGVPFFLEKLNRKLNIYGSKLTIAFLRAKLKESGKLNKASLEIFPDKGKVNLGSFSVKTAKVNHSLPDAQHFLINTPVGNFYHGADFKFDLTPPDGVLPELSRIAQFGGEKVRCLLSDCLGSEKSGYSPSETLLGPRFEEEMRDVPGRVFITAISSNIFRWQEATDVAINFGRKICLIGMSIQKNLKIADELGYFKVKRENVVSLNKALKMPRDKVAFLIAGSLGQTGSSLSRMVLGKHILRAEKGDKVIFSSPDYVPGTSTAIDNLINLLVSQDVDVAYEEMAGRLHVSGHGYRQELALLASLVRPDYFLPIGGEWRHAGQYRKLMGQVGFDTKKVIIPEQGTAPTFWSDGRMDMNYKYQARKILIDGLGVGDVGKTVLRDRRVLSKDGMLTLVLLVDSENHSLVGDPEVVSRGFVYVRKNKQLLGRISKQTAQVYEKEAKPVFDLRYVRTQIQSSVEDFVLKETGQQPMVLCVILEV